MSTKSKGVRRTWRDAEEPPEITEKWIAGADLYRGKRMVHRGGHPGTSEKTARRRQH